MLKFSRVLSLLLSLVLIINLVPVSADEEVVLDSTNEAAVEAAIGADKLAFIKDRLINGNSENESLNTVILDDTIAVVEEDIAVVQENAEMSNNTAEISTTSTSELMSSAIESRRTNPTGLPYFSDNENDAKVSLRTGAAIYTKSLLSLPGKNGLNLDLSITYNSDAAVRGSGDGVRYSNYAENLNYRSFAIGWDLDLPQIIKTYKPDIIFDGTEIYKYLPSIKLADGGYYNISGDKDISAERMTEDLELELDDYYGNPITIVREASTNQYVVTYSEDGHKEYFDGTYGNLVKTEDKYGNDIDFHYTDIEYYACENVEMNKETDYIRVLSSITDSVGRNINLSYTTEEYESDCGTYTRVKDITITVNENGSVKTYAEIELDRTDVYTSGGNKYADIINCIKDADGKETSFNYDIFSSDSYFNTPNGTVQGGSGKCIRLKNINYPTGGQKSFEYAQIQRNAHYVYNGNGIVTGPYRVLSTFRYYIYKVSSLSDSSGDVVTYSFGSDHFGCVVEKGYFASVHNGSVNINESAASVTHHGITTNYRFDENGNLSKETTYPSDQDSLNDFCRYRTDYVYDDDHHKLVSKTYTVIDCVRNGETLTETEDERWTENYTYNSDNLVSSYTDKLGNRTEYTYFTYPTYPSNMLNTETQYANLSEDQRIVTTYTPTADKLNYAQVTTDYGDEEYTTKYTYDANFKGNVVRQEEYHTTDLTTPDIVKTYSYNDVDDVTNTNGKNAFVTKEAVLDVKTNSTSFTDSTSNFVTYYKYGDAGRLVSVTDAEGNTTTYTYNNCGDVTNVTTPDNKTVTTTYTYSPTGENSVVKGIKGVYRTYEYYDGLGRLYYEARGKNSNTDTTRWNEIRYFYDDDRLEYTLDGLGNFVYYIYDSYGRVTAELYFSSKTNPETGVIEAATAYAYTLYEYDDCINTADREAIYSYDEVASSITVNKGGKTSTIYYDEFGREILTRTNSQAGIMENWKEYDNKGNVITTGDYENNWVGYTYDNRRLPVVVEVENTNTNDIATTTYEYNAFGNPTSVTTPGNKTTTYEYDSLGRLIKETDPMEYTEEYAYDKVGNVISKKDKNGVVTNNTYNNMYYLTNTTTGGLSISYTYDSLGRMLSEVNADSFIYYAYTDNKLSSVTYNGGKSIRYTYDKMNNIKTVRDFSGSTFIYAYDPLYNCDYILQDNYPVADYTYDASGAMTSVSHQNGKGYVYYAYDNAMQVTKVTNKYNNNVISEYNYTYDTTGNIATKNDGTTLTTYTYGLGNRLMSSTDRVTTGTDENGDPVYEDTVTNYTYDLDGNLTKKAFVYPASYEYSFTALGEEKIMNSISTHEINYSYDANNRLTREYEILIGPWKDDWMPRLYQNTTNYTYDNNGNTLTSVFDAGANEMDGDSKAYTYNKRNQLIGYSKNDEEVSSYAYYADGLRRSKTVGDDTTYFYYDRGNIVAEGDGTKITAQNVFGAQGIIKRVVGEETEYYFKDAHGDVKQTVDGTTSEVTQSYTYDAYGNEADPSATDTNPFRYCGEYYDDESGLIYLRNRYYDPSTQRFITEDPAKDGINWYAYCGGNPVMFVDPWGLYNRSAALNYAIKWHNGYNTQKYPRMDGVGAFVNSMGMWKGDCANFASQVLFAGGIKMNDDWYIKSKYVWHSGNGYPHTEYSFAAAWAGVDAQYRYFSNTENGYSNGTVIVNSASEVSFVAKTGEVQAGDIAFMDFEGDGVFDHSIIISGVDHQNGEIYYAAHTKPRDYYSLTDGMKSEGTSCKVYIVKIKDDAQ